MRSDDSYLQQLKENVELLRKMNFFVPLKGGIKENNSYQSSDITQIYVNPSLDCNLNCWFCYAKDARKKNDSKLDFEGISKIIIPILDYKKENNFSDSIGFSIGFTEELTLNFQLFKRIKSFIYKIKNQYEFSIFLFLPSTNLMQVTEEYVDFINDYKHLTVSIDLDNKNQVNNVVQNIEKFKRDVEKNLIIPIHSKIENIYDIYSKFSNYFDYISLRPVRVKIDSEYPWTLETLSNIKMEISKLFKKLLLLDDENLLSFFEKIGPTDYFARYFHRIIERQKLDERCIAGKTAFAISSVLEISPCSSLSDYEGLSVKISDFNIQDALEKLRKEIPNYKETECSTCYIQSYCGGPCMDWVVKLDDQNLLHPNKIECDFNKHIVDETLFFISDLIEDRKTLFDLIVKEKKLRNRLNYPLDFNQFSKFFS
ncbi:MAG: hypothetical protein KAU62_04450 [Candidatus Heimdallarchaeota archaeon]|nr:hypothetical protein [Candidatus Heimdallarchaeota archaeon]MCG3255316.1 hypothetical protein [Candidatus Heimdallarchaeota archaeon]MCK4610389.1 hypothetical protein [Candidatus Heimdallarchaeota archaeon]